MFRTYALAILCLVTITACAHPVDRAIRARAELHEQSFQTYGRISAGACDDLGQLIPNSYGSISLHAAASSRE